MKSMDLESICRTSTYVIKSAVAESIELIYGQSRSIYRGLGYEYIDFRPYFIGDDVRHIDWRISARTMTNPYSIDLYVREYINETKVDTLIVLDLHRSLLFWDKLYTVLYVSAMILSLAYKLGDKVTTLILNGDEQLIIPSSNPRDIIEYIRRNICTIREYSVRTGLHQLYNIIPRLKKIRGILVLTDYAVEPAVFIALNNIVKTINGRLGVIVSTHIYETKPPVKDALLFFKGFTRSGLTSIKEVYSEVNKHISMVKASILSGTRIFLELYGLEEARNNRFKILRTYTSIRGRQEIF